MKTKYLRLLLAPVISLTNFSILTSTTSPVDGVSITPEAAIGQTLQNIRDDLKRLKSMFPQLESIDDAVIKSGVLRYQKGLLKDSKIRGPVFEKNGCDVYVEIKYPATREDIDMRPLSGVIIPMKNGKSFAVCRSVRAENDEQGSSFTKKVNEIVSLRSGDLRKELDSRMNTGWIGFIDVASSREEGSRPAE